MKANNLIYSGIVFSLIPSAMSAITKAPTQYEPEKTGITAWQDARPNILFIVSEDNGPDLGCYGAPVKTPVLDQLAAEGIRFQNAYVSQAGSSPSRASFLTGLYPHQNGQLGLATWRYRMYQPNTPNLVNSLKGSGYRTGIIGKIHVNPQSAFDFDFAEIPSANFDRNQLHMYAEHAASFFNESDAPFYLQVNYPDAHTPFTPQVDGMPEKILTGADVDALPLLGVTSDSIRQLTADYYNCMMRLDEMIGQLLDRLRESGKYENTLILYIGDHGVDIIRGKRTCYEGGIRIPMIASWQGGQVSGAVSEELISIIDIYPTFMELSGNPIPSHLPGKSFLPLLTGLEYQPREYLFAQYHVHSNHNPYPQRSVRDARYKLIYSPLHGTMNPDYNFTLSRKVGDRDDFMDALTKAPPFVRETYARMANPPEFELYDLLYDPYEWHNLSSVPAYQNILERLKQAMFGWMEETNDPILLPGKAERFFNDVNIQGLERGYFPYHEYMDPGMKFNK